MKLKGKYSHFLISLGPLPLSTHICIYSIIKILKRKSFSSITCALKSHSYFHPISSSLTPTLPSYFSLQVSSSLSKYHLCFTKYLQWKVKISLSFFSFAVSFLAQKVKFSQILVFNNLDNFLYQGFSSHLSFLEAITGEFP